MAAQNGWQEPSNRVLKGIAIDPRLEYSMHELPDIPQLWYPLVEDYSNRQLTFKSDKTIAVTGLVDYLKQCNPLYDRECIVGVWQGDVKGLLWSIIKPESILAYDGTHYPSWSWAWTNSTISYWSSKTQEVSNTEDTDAVVEIVNSWDTPFNDGTEEKYLVRAFGTRFPITVGMWERLDLRSETNQIPAPNGNGFLRICWDHIHPKRVPSEGSYEFSFFQMATTIPMDSNSEMGWEDISNGRKTAFLVLRVLWRHEGEACYRREGIGWYDHLYEEDFPFPEAIKDIVYIC